MGSVSFTDTGKPAITLNEAYQTSADISFSASAIANPSPSYDYNIENGYADEEKKYKNYTNYKGYYSFNTISYAWKFLDKESERVIGNSGTYSYIGLNIGEKNNIQATCYISATETDNYTVTKHEWIVSYEKDEVTGEDKVDENGEKIPIYTEVVTTSNHQSSSLKTDYASTSLIVYTHPGTFTDYNFSKDTIIQSSEGLTEEKVSKWCSHAGKFLSWRDKTDKYGSVDSCKVNEGSLITADWYNKCADTVGSSLRVNKGDLITALAFKNLGDAIN